MNVLPLIPRVFFSGLRYRRIHAAACAVLALFLSSLQPAGAAVVKTIVRMETNLGSFNIGLYDDDAPKTVRNFLNYVERGDYNSVIIHRSVPGFVIQGGGYKCCDFFGRLFPISPDSAVKNEYNSSRSNKRGTITMAKLPLTDDSGDLIPGGGPDSATSEWFFNLDDNSGSPDTNPPGLDYQNGGFTVFGHVLDSGMDIVDEIASLQPVAVSGFPNLPVFNNYYVIVSRVCLNNDADIVCSATEDLAQGGDGNTDGTPDSEQANVTTFFTSLNALATLAADSGMRFSSITAIDKDTALSWLKKFTSPPNQTLHFNNGTLRFTVVGTIDGKKTVTLHDGAATRPAYYYAYGPTADNPTPHWYDFSYDGETGAEITNDRITLHFVDGKRGDDDYTANGSVTHTGAQAVVTSTTTSSSPASGGCSIAATSKNALRAGDWILVSLFLAVVTLVRRRTRCSGRVGIAHRKQLRLPSDGGLCPPYV